jgi:hypothetical protein
MSWNDEWALGALVVCLPGIAVIGLLSMLSRAQAGQRQPRDGAAQRPFLSTPHVVYLTGWLSMVGVGSWARGSSLGLPDLSDRSALSLACSFGADLLTVAWGALLAHHGAWPWVVGSAVAAATVGSIAFSQAYERVVFAGDGPYLGLAFVVELVVSGVALLVGASCAALALSVASLRVATSSVT